MIRTTWVPGMPPLDLPNIRLRPLSLLTIKDIPACFQEAARFVRIAEFDRPPYDDDGDDEEYYEKVARS